MTFYSKLKQPEMKKGGSFVLAQDDPPIRLIGDGQVTGRHLDNDRQGGAFPSLGVVIPVL